jgi:quercetin dioxygenase-like cupin family protein
MTERIYDPNQRYQIEFHRDGENLVMDVVVERGGGVPTHFHPTQEERFAIEEGRVRFRVGRRRLVAGPGDEIVVPAGTKHWFRNVGDGQARFRAELRPGADAVGFFEETSAAAQEGLYTPRGIPKSFRGAVRAAEILDRYRDVAVICVVPPVLQRVLFPPLLRLAGRRG